MENKSIAKLIGSMPLTQFFEHYRSNTPFHLSISEVLLDELKSSSLLGTLDQLFEQWPFDVGAYLEGVADEGNSARVSVDDAKDLFSQGRGLYFDDPNRISPLISEWLTAIHRDLGLSQLTYSRSLIYAIKQGQGTATHFDQNINFVLQLSGTKKWWIAPNTHIENPMTRHTLGLVMDPELSSYAHKGVPEKMPDDAVEYTLTPGSLLFVPRGAWHETQALSDAVSLNFTYSAPAWIDLLTSAIRGRFIQSEKWRETADFVNHPEFYTEALEKFDDLIQELAYDAQHWKASHILGATEAK
ncbi:MAG: cupin-like domain-containing protein [Bacteriovoracaceae bacterium]|nr:cupin-like domain-containing protein [Bacteriovoracaceae bacterium]